MPTENEKKRKAINDVNKAHQERKNELVKDIDTAILTLLDEKKQSLPTLLDERKAKLISDLELHSIAVEEDDLMKLNGNKYAYTEVIQNIFKPIIKWGHKEADYSPMELYNIFDVFVEICNEIRIKEPKFTPTLEHFLFFSDIGIENFRKLQRQEDFRPTCDKIYSYVGMKVYEAGLDGTANNKVVTFIQERDLGKQLAPPVTVNNSQYNTVINATDRQKLIEEIKKY